MDSAIMIINLPKKSPQSANQKIIQIFRKDTVEDVINREGLNNCILNFGGRILRKEEMIFQIPNILNSNIDAIFL
jgi:hypothetical protein